jgi:hypothetical protein
MINQTLDAHDVIVIDRLYCLACDVVLLRTPGSFHAHSEVQLTLTLPLCPNPPT